eukprot:gene21607-16907_t
MPVNVDIIVGAAVTAAKYYGKAKDMMVRKAVEYVINLALPGLGSALSKLSSALDTVVGLIVKVVDWLLEKLLGITAEIVGVFIGIHI